MKFLILLGPPLNRNPIEQFVPNFQSIIGRVVKPGLCQFSAPNCQQKHLNRAFVVKITLGVCLLVGFQDFTFTFRTIVL